MNTQAKPPRPPLNGVDTPSLLGTINVVAGAPDLAKFKFRSVTEWQTGTYAKSTISSFYGAGGDHEHKKAYTFDSDHPAVLCGEDNGVTPVEHLLHALGGCLLAGIGNISAARGVKLSKVIAKIEGDLDLQGLLGISDEVRNGYQSIDVKISIEGDAPREKLEAIVEQSRARSAVFDVLTNGVPVNVSVAA
ncbi:OsmC family protein [Pseudoruegeria sp. HB172150]|uniref:OsmC family protein n=1 Tax=Pseudoruegeria sp. HB172150 TaxID=2721164 RepID=UPI001553DDCF|nr:OsmC family protein [Pseudoruegeria sp. HB172150]